MSTLDFNQTLTTFLRTKGVSLIQYGSAEFGLSRNDAESFLSMLGQAGRRPLGIEVWRRTGNKLSIDSLDGWYASISDETANQRDASEFMRNVVLADGDVVTIQFT